MMMGPPAFEFGARMSATGRLRRARARTHQPQGGGSGVHPMRYEDGRREPNPTARDIYGAWALVGVILLSLTLLSFA